MASSSSIQFRGVEDVLEAYENRGVANWSIWQGRQFMFKYEGNNAAEGLATLEKTLDILAKASNAIYTLKVYEDANKIKSNTPDDGSFNFRLNEETQPITQGQYTHLNNLQKIDERMSRIEEALLSREEENEEQENKLGVIGEIIGHPTIQPLVQAFLSSIFTPKQPAQVPQQQQPVNNVPMQRVSLNGIDDDARLTKAIEALSKTDPKLTEHLEKLARLAQDSPDSFKFLIATLDNMQV